MTTLNGIGLGIIALQFFGLVFGTIQCYRGGKREGNWTKGIPWLMVGVLGAPVIFLLNAVTK